MLPESALGPRDFTGRYRFTIEGVTTDGEEAYLLFIEARQRAVDLGGVEMSVYDKLDADGVPFYTHVHDEACESSPQGLTG